MPALKFTGGVQRKLSNGDFGSFGASAEFELTFDPSADRESIPEAILEEFHKARKYVHDELHRQREEFKEELREAGERLKDRDRSRDDRDEPEYAGARSTGDGRHNGNGHSANGHTKQRTDWDRNRRPEAARDDDRRPERRDDRDRDRSRDDRGRGRDDRRGGSGGGYGVPRTGSQMFAWAKGEEEKRDERGFVKALQKIGQEKCGSWKFNDLSREDLEYLYNEGQRLLENRD